MAPPQTTIPTLHNLGHSQAFRVLWALEEIKLVNPAFEFKFINYPRKAPRNKDLVKVHRLGKSPILTLETTDGTPPPIVQLEPGVLTEAKLILEYIKKEYSNGLWTPKDEEDANRDRFLCEFATDTLLVKTDFVLVLSILSTILPWPLSWVARTVNWPMIYHFSNDLREIFQLLEDSLTAEKPWFGGKQMGLSDFNMTFGMDMAEQQGYFNPAKYPKLKVWMESVRGRESYKKAIDGSGGYNLKDFKGEMAKGVVTAPPREE